ncbi:MAG: peptide chain release factor 1 [Deltaproteobacteria bacterium]|nr:MAG: peptide chain release factor 1 [Deltaproteobacteria bacterium]
MYEKLEGVLDRFEQLEQLMSDPGVIGNMDIYQKYMKEHGDIAPLVDKYREYKLLLEEIDEHIELSKDSDAEMRALAIEELPGLEEKKEEVEHDLKLLLIPRDPNDSKDVILEIRAGTGGDEAGLFAADLFRMYTRFAESKNMKIEIMDSSSAGAGGFKEVIAHIKGRDAFRIFKYESGTHRVQRVPVTETQGRIHTSAVTVAVLPEAEDVDVHIDPSDLRIDYFRATGPGGQSVNTTDSAVRITHLPTGVVATCQDQKSQHKNREKAMKVLKARILDAMIQEQNEKRSRDRKEQVGTGDRSGRIRTYNFPQGRVTDHRINLTLYKLDQIMEGSIDAITDALSAHYNAKALQDADL